MPQNNPGQVTVPNTEVHRLPSTLVGQEYELLVAKPKNYDGSQDRYPMLVVLDANWHFALVTQLLRTMQFFEDVPQMLVVGIAYPTEVEGDLWALRARDYTPTEDEGWAASFTATYGLPLTQLPRATGGAPDFVQFVRHELLPFIDATYRTDKKNRTLAGWSFGGLFALYALFNEPDLFNRYLILSPSVWWDNKIILAHEEEYAANHARLPARLFFSVGDNEGAMVPDMKQIVDKVEGRKYQGLHLTKRILADETHATVVANAYSKGIRTLFLSCP